MLTLTRKLGESLRIGDDVVIVVKEIRRNSIRLSIECPTEIRIYREEVYQNLQYKGPYSLQDGPEMLWVIDPPGRDAQTRYESKEDAEEAYQRRNKEGS